MYPHVVAVTFVISQNLKHTVYAKYNPKTTYVSVARNHVHGEGWKGDA